MAERAERAARRPLHQRRGLRRRSALGAAAAALLASGASHSFSTFAAPRAAATTAEGTRAASLSGRLFSAGRFPAATGNRLLPAGERRSQAALAAYGSGLEAWAGDAGTVALGGVLGLAVLYAIMSVNEYIYHRYFQHLGINKLGISRVFREALGLSTFRGDGHVEHHRETLDDMSLDARPNEMLDADPYRGTAFPWWATSLMTASVLVPVYPLLTALGWPGPLIVVAVVVAVILHALTWNALHPNMHGLPDVPLSHGAPSAVLAGFRDSAYFSWLRMNHEGHHRIEGAHGNYNVCCPLVDQLVGTYVGEIPPAAVKAEA